ncbi:hypothetical protein HRI_005267100 [Hibiscus trionum]|uniref:Uncharacterized protein n=1 Tax=Hibiscus trionum TaxID=183268 RepID=A0A9W7JLF6_HIBTR|nr:hypothetical protein HRI_005267100 [Hibiscus trionum]
MVNGRGLGRKGLLKPLRLIGVHQATKSSEALSSHHGEQWFCELGVGCQVGGWFAGSKVYDGGLETGR